MDDLNNKEEYQDSEIVIQNLLDDFSTQREALLQMVLQSLY